jgi:hypothetical protein
MPMPHCFREVGKKLCIALTLQCLLCGVALAQSVDTSYVPGVNFSKYRTYRWVEIKGQIPDPTLDAQIKQSFDSQLAAKGLTKADEAADLYIDYQAAVRKTEKWEVYEDWTQPSFPDQRLPQRRKVTIDVGTLVVDMYDTAEKELIWSGSVTKTIDLNSSPGDRQKNLDRAATKLLTNFPPK